MGTIRLKKLLSFIATLIVMFTALPHASMESYSFVVYTKRMVELKNDTSPNAATVIQVPSQSALTVTGEHGEFYIAVYEGKSGYVLKSIVNDTQDLQNSEPHALPPSEAALSKYVLLKEGDASILVNALQNALKELGFLKGKADGKYGKQTKTAVQAFQKANALPENGIADVETQRKMFEENVNNAKGKKVKVKAVPSAVEAILRPGNYGAQVENLQKRLAELNYYKGKIDGKYGKGTQNAVRAFQKANRLKVDGKAGAKTQELLFSDQALAKGEKVQPTPKPTKAPAPSEKKGESVPTVPPSKNEAAAFPFETTSSDSVNIRRSASTRSTRLGTIPKGASLTVHKLQGDYLKISYGKINGYVLAKYINIPEQYLPGKSFEEDAAARRKYETLAQGSSGAKVKALQQALHDLGFYNGKADGEFEQKTGDAVKLFQGKNGYKQTGIALPELQHLLYEGRPRNAKNRKMKVLVLPPIEDPQMHLGVKGDAVIMLQNALKEFGYFKGSVNGVYDRATENAVKAYQKAHSIRQSGKMDAFTWRSIKTVLEKSHPKTEQPSNEINEQNVVIMRKGTRGLAVSHLQAKLIILGYFVGPADGIYADSTVDAVSDFQRENGIAATGVADLNTQLAIFSDAAKPKANAPAGNDSDAIKEEEGSTIAENTAKILKIGVSGDAVKALQTRLIALGYLSQEADGIYGTATAKAVAAFQRAHKLEPDGIAGEKTLTQLYGADASRSEKPKKDTEDKKDGLPRTIKLGMHGEDVKQLQKRLTALKYYSAAIDGVYGPNTELALRAFQQKNKLRVDGIVGSLTWAKLHADNAIAAGGLPIPNEKPAPTPPPPQPSPGTPGSSDTDAAFVAPKASEVINAPWFSQVRSVLRKMPNVIVYDFLSGTHYNIHLFSLGKHADGEPVTKEDTRKMFSALGEQNWTPRPVWVILSDGRVFMASTHSRGHEVDLNPNNGLNGHICIHFPRDMEEAAKTGPYAVAHQNAILAGWDLTKEMAK